MGTRLVVVGIALALAGCKDHRARAEKKADEVVDQAGKKAGEVYDQAWDAVGVARSVKAELDKVYKTDRDYDLAITRAGASTAHAARLEAMPHVTVGGVTVGYEESTTRSLHGVAYARHFRATWRRGDEDVVVSYATQEEIDAVAFAALVQKMVPIVESAIN